MTPAAERIELGFIGVGRMGKEMATRLLQAGHRVRVYDTNSAAVASLEALGATPAASVEDVGAHSDIVLLSLPSPEVVSRVVAVLAQAPRAGTVIDHSTTGLPVARDSAGMLSARGKILIDAPVSGGVRGAAAGTLTIMVAGPADAIERCSRILATLGREVVVVGDTAGQAQVVKLANNMISAAAMIATNESMIVGAKAGLDPELMLRVLNASTGRNSHTEDKYPKYVLTRSFDFGFSMGLLNKDVRLGLETASALDVPMSVTTMASEVWTRAMDESGPDTDMTSIVECFEGWTGTRVASATPSDVRETQTRGMS